MDRRQCIRAFAWVGGFIAAGAYTSVGCRRSESAPSASVSSDAAGLNPIQTIQRIRVECDAGRHSAAETYLLAEQRKAVIAQIRAVDRLQSAAEALARRAADRFGLAAAEALDFTRSADVLGVLSRHARLVSQRVESDRATVVYQVGDRLPLESVELMRRGDGWILVTEAIEGVPEEIAKLAGVVERSIGGLLDDGLTLEELRRDVDLRASPIFRRLQHLTESASRRPTDQVD
ncbi:MAG: hypothetical protein HOP29_19820 [Phycisphaerales bacterium]|nr:hypothetical protein [Phycisphaerales bacterium]